MDLELCWGTCRGLGLAELANVAGQAGFQAITIPPEMYFVARREGYSDDDLHDALDAAGVVVSVIDPLTAGLPGIPASADVAPQMRSFVQFSARECFEVASALRAPVVNVAHFLGTHEHTAQLARTVEDWCAVAAEHDVRLALEFIPGTGFPDLATTASIIQAIGAPNLGLTFDTWHFYRSGGTVADLEGLTVRVFSVQLNDATESDAGGGYVPMVDRMLPGSGDLPLVRLVDKLLPLMPAERIGVEVFRKDFRRMPPLSVAAAALEATWHTLSASTGDARGVR